MILTALLQIGRGLEQENAIFTSTTNKRHKECLECGRRSERRMKIQTRFGRLWGSEVEWYHLVQICRMMILIRDRPLHGHCMTLGVWKVITLCRSHEA